MGHFSIAMLNYQRVSATLFGNTTFLATPFPGTSRVDATWYSTFRGRRPAELDLDEAKGGKMGDGFDTVDG